MDEIACVVRLEDGRFGIEVRGHLTEVTSAEDWVRVRNAFNLWWRMMMAIKHPGQEGAALSEVFEPN